MRKTGIAILASVVLLTVAAARVIDVLGWRTQTLQAAEARAANLALMLSEYLHESFAACDAPLRQLVLHSGRIGGPSAPDGVWTPLLDAARAGVHNIGAISVVDASGIVRHSTQPAIVGQSRRDQYVFKRLAEASADELVIDTPSQTIVDPQAFVIPIGRRLVNDAGAFEGAVVASFVPATARSVFRTVDVGQRGAIWVFHPSAAILFREPSPGDPFGQSAAGNPIFEAGRRQGEGSLEGPLVAGGPRFLSAFRSLTTPPLLIAVSLDRAEAFSDWRRQALRAAAIGLTLVTLLITTLVVLLRQTGAKVRAERALEDTRREEAERLREANERLASAVEMRDEFLMTVSHELRTPLSSIYGWTRILLAGGLDVKRTSTALETIDRNARALTRLIDDLLDVSRALGGKLRLDIHPVQLAEVIQHVLETSRPAAEAKAIRLTSMVDQDIPSVLADSGRLQQIVWNLVSNAIKFTPEAGRVDVHVARRDGSVEIAVSDSGAGIQPDFLPHVFERFRQGEAGSTRRHGGLGLGLAIVRNLVELHGGTVTAESAGAGMGATFRVRLPAKVAVDHAPSVA